MVGWSHEVNGSWEGGRKSESLRKVFLHVKSWSEKKNDKWKRHRWNDSKVSIRKKGQWRKYIVNARECVANTINRPQEVDFTE